MSDGHFSHHSECFHAHAVEPGKAGFPHDQPGAAEYLHRLAHCIGKQGVHVFFQQARIVADDPSLDLVLPFPEHSVRGALRCRISRICACNHLTNCCRSEEHKSELQSLMLNSYAAFCWQKKKKHKI